MSGGLAALGKLFPALGWLRNRLRLPGLHCGIHVEIEPRDAITYGQGVVIGGFTRLYLARGSLQLDDGVGLGRDVQIQTDGGTVRVGANTGVNDGARISGNVSIGRDCAIGPNLLVSSGSHVFRSTESFLLISEQERRYPAPDRPVVIGEDCWIGINVVILPGVTIGRGAVIAANSVVRASVAPYTIVGGAPAKPIGERLLFAPPREVTAKRPEDGPYFYSGFHQRAARGGAFICDGDCVLALNGEGAQSVELEVGAQSAGTITRQGHRVPFRHGRNTLRLPIAALELPFIAFQVDGACGLHAARLTGTPV